MFVFVVSAFQYTCGHCPLSGRWSLLGKYSIIACSRSPLAGILSKLLGVRGRGSPVKRILSFFVPSVKPSAVKSRFALYRLARLLAGCAACARCAGVHAAGPVCLPAPPQLPQPGPGKVEDGPQIAGSSADGAPLIAPGRCLRWTRCGADRAGPAGLIAAAAQIGQTVRPPAGLYLQLNLL